MQEGSCWFSCKTFYVGPFVSERNLSIGWFYFWSPFVASIRGPHSWSTLVAPFMASICGPHSWFSTVVLTVIWGWLLKICVYFRFMQSTLKAIDLHFQARVQQNLENGNDWEDRIYKENCYECWSRMLRKSMELDTAHARRILKEGYILE